MKRHLLAATALALWMVTPAGAQSVQAWQYQNINTSTTTTMKSSPGVLHSVCINTPVATGTIQIYDNTAGSGNKIGLITIQSSPQPICQIYDVAFWTGLTIVTAVEQPDITVSFR
jgi:hypothetical protein